MSGATPMNAHDTHLEHAGEADAILDLRDTLRLVLRRALPITIAGAVTAVLVFLVSALGPARYTSYGLLMISPQNDGLINLEAVLSALPLDSPAVESEVEVLRSSAILGRVVDRLGLIDAPDSVRDDAVRRQEAINRLARNIGVKRKGTSFVIEVSAEGASPREARERVDAMLATYLDAQRESKVEAAHWAAEWLGRRLAELKDEVNQREAAVEFFRAQSGLLAAEGSPLTEQKATDVQRSLLIARADVAEKEARYHQVTALLGEARALDTIASVVNSDSIRELRRIEASASAKQAELEIRLAPGHPDLRQARRERADVAAMIAEEVRRIAESLRNEVDVAKARLRAVQESSDAVTGELGAANQSLVRLRELERDAAAKRAVYESFLQRFQEISQAQSLVTLDARIVSQGSLPLRPSAPKPKLALALALVLGGVVGLGAGLLAEALDDRFGSREEVERKLGLPALASIPELTAADLAMLPAGSRHPAHHVVARPLSFFAEALRGLRSVLLPPGSGRAGEGQGRVIVVTSALPDEGKTTLAVCLARLVALSGERAILVDCDLRRRAIDGLAGDAATRLGLIDILAGEGDWREAVITDAQSRADMMPLAGSRSTADGLGLAVADLFGGPAMRVLLDELRADYDLVVLDASPALAVSDTRLLAIHADGCVLATRWGKTPARAARAAVHLLAASSVTILGVVLTRVDLRQKSRLGDRDPSVYFSAYGKRYLT